MGTFTGDTVRYSCTWIGGWYVGYGVTTVVYLIDNDENGLVAVFVVAAAERYYTLTPIERRI